MPEAATATPAATAAPTPSEPDEEARTPRVPEGEPERLSNRPAEGDAGRYRPGKGLEIKSADGDFALATRLRAQFLYTLNSHPDAEDSQSFQIRRARLQFVGNMWGENNEFKVELAFAPGDLSRGPQSVGAASPDDPMTPVEDHTHEIEDVVSDSPLLDWYMDFTHLRDLSVRLGQSKVPYSRQRVVSSGDLQFVDRGVSNAEFNVDRDLGIDLRSRDLGGLGLLRYYAGVYIGEGRNTSDRTIGSGDFGMMYLARLEVQPFGDFDDYSEADFARSDTPGMSLGAGYAYIADAPGSQGILGSALSDETDFHNGTVDLMFKLAGFSLYTDFFVRKGKADSDTRDGLGWMAQAGYLIPTLPLEIGARYGMTRDLGDSSALTDADQDNELGGVLSYYFAHHHLKIQADFFRLWTEATDFGDAENRLRVQMQAAL